MTQQFVHELIKDDRIQLKDKKHMETKCVYTEAELSKMDEACEATFNLQKELGLGVPDASGIKRGISNVKQRKILDEILQSNNEFYLVELPDEKILPRFTRASNGLMEEQSNTRFDTPPLLAIAKLAKDVRNIRCNGNGKDYQAPIPLIPRAALEKAAQLRTKDENIEFHIAYMPSWEPVPQRDPILLAKIANEYIAVHGWGGDKEVLDEFIVPKQ